MTAEEFRARLDALGLSQPAFARVVSDAGGEDLPLGTVRNWAQGRREIPVTVPALMGLFETLASLARPEALDADRDFPQRTEDDERDAGRFAPDGDHDGIHALEGA
jgi:hypothetical protein